MITVNLINYNGLSNVIDKPLIVSQTINGLFFKPFNRLSAVLQIRYDNPENFNYNYLEIEGQGFYFVKSKETANKNVLSLQLDLDVLTTNKTAILNAVGTVVTSELSNKYISSREYVTDVRPQFTKVMFSRETPPFDENGGIIMITLKGKA